MRIVSLLPSATEIICALGLEDQLVGVTHECDYPPSVARLPKVTKTLIPTNASSREIDALVRDRLGAQSALYTLDMDALETLRPDLIVTQALCDVCAVAEEEVKSAACKLSSLPNVLNLEPETLDEIGRDNLFGNLDDALNRARRILGVAEEAAPPDIEPTVERERTGEHQAT